MKAPYHRCGGCGRKLPLDKQSPYYCSQECHEARKIKARGYAKRAYDKDPEKYRARSRAWTKKSPNVAKAAQKNWRSKNKERIRQSQKAWAAANRDTLIASWRRWVAANPEKNRAKVKAWARANPERDKALHDARRARVLGASGKYTAAEWRARLEQFDHRCCYCGSSEDVTLDHLVALARGGSNNIDNIVPACRRCNSSKKASDVRKWLIRMFCEQVRLTPFAMELMSGARKAA